MIRGITKITISTINWSFDEVNNYLINNDIKRYFYDPENNEIELFRVGERINKGVTWTNKNYRKRGERK